MAVVPPTVTLANRIHRRLGSIPTGLLWLLVFLWSIPTLGLFVNSFRERDDQLATGWWKILADEGGVTIDNYVEILSSGGSGGIGQALLNSLAIAIPATVIPIAIATFAAYAFAWMNFKGRSTLFIATISLLAIPLQVALLPLLKAYSDGAHWTIPFVNKTITLIPDLDLSGTVAAVWLTHTGFALPFAIFLLHNYISGLPKDVFESAAIDGADHFTVFWRLVLPLSVPVLAAFAIFQFLWTWNDYLIAITMIGGGAPDSLPATVLIASLSGQFGATEHLLGAGAFMQTVIPITVFFALQRYFVRGILAGSVKG